MFLVDHIENREPSFDRERFRSTFKDLGQSSSFMLDRETRRSVIAPIRSSLEFPVTLPPGAVLRFAMGVATAGEIESTLPIRFRIRLKHGGVDENLFEETIGRRNLWIDRELKLDHALFKDVRLVFETEWGRGSPPDDELDDHVLPLWGSPIVTSSSSPSEKPLLVLISIDCLRADHVGAYGYDQPTTPNLDRFAEQAVVYEEAVSTSSWTLPTHMSMLTGLTPSQHGVVNLDRKLDPGTPSLPDLLHRAGYETMGIVTWWFVSQAYGFDKGFDLFRLSLLSSAEDVVDDALALLRSDGIHGKFLFLHLLEPHWEYAPPAELLDRFGSRPKDISRLLEMVDQGRTPTHASEIEEIIRLYDGEIAHVDRELGRFFASLESLGLYDPALIVVTADHGEAFYEHASWQHGRLYEEVLRVPLMVKFPDNAPGRVASPVSLTSVFTTFLDEADVETSDGMPPGLFDYAIGEASSRLYPIISEYHVTSETRHGAWPPRGTSLMVSFRREGLKYIATLGGTLGDEVVEPTMIREELYALENDRGELEDLALELTQEKQSFRAMLHRYLKDSALSEKARRTAPVTLDDETKRLLEGLSYVSQ